MTDTWIPLSDPDYSAAEIAAVQAVLGRSQQSDGPFTEAFEAAFAAYLGRRHAVAVSSGTIGLLLALKAAGIGAGDEVVAPGYGWRQTAQAIPWSGATPVLADIDYWSQTLAPDKAEAKVTQHTRAILANNVNGHPADWTKLRELADKSHALLIEDATESIGSHYQGKIVGNFGDVAVFDFSQPSVLCCGQAAMIATDDDTLALKLRHYRNRRRDERGSLTATLRPPLDAGISELAAALGLIQLQRLPEILARRKQVEAWYQAQISSFEGIKPPYIAPGVEEVHWLLYTVHLGTRFTASSRDALVDDLETEQVEAAAYCRPLHLQRAYIEQYGTRKGDLLVTEKVADRAIALPFHGQISEDQVAFIVKTAKDASINVGAGAAIYL
ncbi:MAG TPA: DegT/DnrJ/EryC1/StrS family aminotransferase [Novimethylophilus sp.]|jgi:dTDP-4-amino-4,6-dideoxygalactose transaminase|uniref:DegT/DnrJ/EryC1/StrS family aminotransferase n=1 Tax=Novimethylophilus sp. TaxID=2137426 RepID=UPI002F40FFA8